ncbi:hypothetical protein DTO271G3_6030 [Paecilomyces variotii]|nr:hypothetical protein DTO271G3_6030 [Paecilomyces variotii]
MSQAYISRRNPLQDHGFSCIAPQKNHSKSTTTISKSLGIQSEILPYDTKCNLEEGSRGPTESITLMDESRPSDISQDLSTQAQEATTDELQLPIKLGQFLEGEEGTLSAWSDTSPSGCEQEEQLAAGGSPHSSPLRTASRSIKALFRHISHSAPDEPCREISTTLSPKASASSRRHPLPFSSPRRDSPYVGALKTRSPSLGGSVNRPGPPDFSIPADSGVGLKARRMSANVPDDFTVNSCDLSDEFTTASKVPGRRGREIGKGSTATVKIVYRKDSPENVQYAAKEFRKCGSQEDEVEYKKKVKSEFSIANSLHHPNIVKTTLEYQKFSAASIQVYALPVVNVGRRWAKCEDVLQEFAEACRTLLPKFWQKKENMILDHLMFGPAPLSALLSASVALHGSLRIPKILVMLNS